MLAFSPSSDPGTRSWTRMSSSSPSPPAGTQRRPQSLRLTPVVYMMAISYSRWIAVRNCSEAG